MTPFAKARAEAGFTLEDIVTDFNVALGEAERWELGLRPAPAHVLKSLDLIRRFNGHTLGAQLTCSGPANPPPTRYPPLRVEAAVTVIDRLARRSKGYVPMKTEFSGGETVTTSGSDEPTVEIPSPLRSKLSDSKPRLLDLFCCAGGAALGYARAGFEVVGVDIVDRPNFPFAFIKADAMKLDPEFIASFDAIHASPPCQSYSDLAKRNRNGDQWPRLIEPVREMLIASGRPYIIENVEGAPLLDPVVLCGTMFPGLRVLRHRLFEANFVIKAPPHKKHPKVHTFDKRKSHFGKTNEWTDFVQVTGGGNCSVAAARDAMGIDWMTKGEINEAIPPAYTELIGRQLLAQLQTAAHIAPKVREAA